MLGAAESRAWCLVDFRGVAGKTLRGGGVDGGGADPWILERDGLVVAVEVAEGGEHGEQTGGGIVPVAEAGEPLAEVVWEAGGVGKGESDR